MRGFGLFLVTVSLLSVSAMAARADEIPTYALQIKNHQFAPAKIQIPANKKVKLVIANHDATPEEFESYGLNLEKIIAGGSEGIVFVGPLDPGAYPFFGDFNQATAQGTVVAE